jgi:demethylmenaquinone methyltransferase/2-methoxy-6-polyprenyl-1,4-benzoquinol methylase
MAQLSGNERARYVQAMFTRIAHRYDLLNRLMTAGQDVRWRLEVIRRLALPPGGTLLDVGAGTGDLARQALLQASAGISVAADFTLEMMRVGQRHPAQGLRWVAADALNLPFADECFDGLVSGFLLRNVSDLPRTLSEQYRLLKPGGRMVALDTTRPPQNALTPLINFHLQRVIPALGRLVAGDAEAYTYLPDSTREFLSADHLAEHMRAAGFREVGYTRRMFGTVAIHWGTK